MAKIVILISIMLLNSYLTESAKLLHDRMNDKSGLTTDTSKAGENIDPNSAEEENLMLSGTRSIEAATKSKIMYKTRHPRYVINNQIYKEFDARKRWPQCKTIGEVHNDGYTLRSWAYPAAGVLADRICIATNGRYNQLLSTEELISCSNVTTFESGDIYLTDFEVIWGYLKNRGLVSGGKYNTNDGCQPSKIPPIGNIPTDLYNHTCEERCYGNNTINYHHDHVKFSNYYKLNSPEYIQKDVQTYGPVSVYFRVYDDFFLYKSGVYAHTEKSKYVRIHHGKLIGWGVENGLDYWLVVNSWGHEWGHNGLFKIKRGTNECFIENYVYAGLPDSCSIPDPDPKFCKEDGEPCDIYTSICIDNIHYSKESNSQFFTQHNFTLDTEWKSVGKTIYCRNGTCHAEYTMKIEKSTQIEYGNETFSTRSSTVSNSESISKTITASVNAGFSYMGIQLGGSTNDSKQYDSERSFDVTNENGFTVSYSTSTTNTVGVEETITCDGVQNEKIVIQSRTNMIRLTGNFCVYLRYSETFKKHVFKCNYVDLKMYPVYKRNIVTELQCHREIVNPSKNRTTNISCFKFIVCGGFVVVLMFLVKKVKY